MLVLVAHGSRNSRWRDSVQALAQAVEAQVPAQAVEAQVPAEAVEVAFMQFDGPTLAEVVDEGMSRGHQTFRLLPLFMASAGHVDKDIKPLVEELARAHPEITLDLMTPVGEHELFPSLVVEIFSGTHGTR